MADVGGATGVDTSRATDAAEALPSDALRDAGQRLIGLLVQRVTDAAIERVDNLSSRLTDVAENGAPLLRRRDGGGDDEDEGGEQKPGLLSRLGSAVGGIGGKVKEALGGGGGGTGKKLKVTNIVESIDVGLPLRATYNLWTQFGDFPSFMKKVETVDQESDEKTNWKAQVWWSHRTWQATIVEQVPESHIVWKSKGSKGHVDGAVTFTALGPNLTRVLVVLEYWPKGLFEYTGNLWRAQGRRARLELKHFRRHAMTQAILRQDEIEGWRGEIRDSEVVRTHEEAVGEEQEARGPEEEAAPAAVGAEQAEGEEAEPAAAEATEQAEGEAAEYDEAEYDEEAPEGEEAEYDEEAPEGEEAEYDEEEAPEGEEAEYDEEEAPEGEEAEYDEDEAAGQDYEEEDEEEARAADDEEPVEEEPAGDGRAREREPVGARSRRGR